MRRSEQEMKAENLRNNDNVSMRDWRLLFESSTRIFITLPDQMTFTVDGARVIISRIANWFRSHPMEDTEDYYLIASDYSSDYDKYAKSGANVMGMKGKYRIFIVKREVKFGKIQGLKPGQQNIPIYLNGSYWDSIPYKNTANGFDSEQVVKNALEHYKKYKGSYIINLNEFTLRARIGTDEWDNASVFIGVKRK